MTDYMNALIEQMRYFAFASIALAMTFDYAIYKEPFMLKRLCYIFLLVAVIASYNTLLDTGSEMFVSAKDEARTEYYSTMLEVRRGVESGEAESPWYLRFVYYIVYLLLGLCDVFAWLSDQVCRCISVLYKVCCPIAMGLAAWRSLSGIGLKFAVGTLWLCMWSIGTAVADLLIGEITVAALGKAVLSAGSSAAGAVVAGSVALGPALIIGVAIGLVVVLVSMLIFYITIPFMMYSLIAGGDWGQSAGGAMRTAVFGGAAAGVAAQRTFHSITHSVTEENGARDQAASPSTIKYAAATGDSSTPTNSSNYSVMSDLADKQLANSKKRTQA